MARQVVSILRLARWRADLLAVLVAVLAGLYYFGVNPNATLAGLGVGGIAVALTRFHLRPTRCISAACDDPA